MTTLGYSDYYSDSEIPFVAIPEKLQREKVLQVRAFGSDVEIIKELQDKLDLQNQQSVVHFLIEKFNQAENLV